MAHEVYTKEDMVNSLIDEVKKHQKLIGLNDDDLANSYTYAMESLTIDDVDSIFTAYINFLNTNEYTKSERKAMMPAFLKEINKMLNGE